MNHENHDNSGALTPMAPSRPAGNVLGDLARNLAAGLGSLLLRVRAPGAVSAGVLAWVVLEVAGLLTSVGFEAARTGSDGRIDPGALPGQLFHLPWLLLCAWLVTRRQHRSDALMQAVVVLAALWIWIDVLWNLVALLPAAFWERLGDNAQWLWWAPLAWGIVASTVTLCRLQGATGFRRAGVLSAVLLVLVLPQLAVGPQSPLWLAAEPRQDPAEAARWQQARSESVIYRQPSLLTEALARLEPGQPGKTDLFLLAVAGHGAQDVFLREVEKVERLFAERFGTGGRSVVLANNPGTVLTRPLATVSALERSLQIIAQRMDDDEDVLFVFLTSHGAENHLFDLSLWPWELEQLTPQRLAGLLNAAGIRNRVILVSACYSGGFVLPLAGPDTLVMAAARADRSSHGCSHEADWTFFGRAFFDEALRETTSFTDAFERARTAVATREAAEGLEPSEPQIAVGETIRARLADLAAGWQTSPGSSPAQAASAADAETSRPLCDGEPAQQTCTEPANRR
ncbi:C13 family peptidase [Methyloversatilis sp.]|uniref:C13 family peptidase n=1 Tax=Methyloversatilis sp. TaxID=2569862 RepID=UPI002734243E|nr:C13 family peptidase [Methyloversatilis sp.]MDP2868863.1 C13 family peptidase [Methyloversatilis sp.]MDP3457476.1 C13 family peptidase [Methyloversatilis sp.]MDP3579335.1 C13 family peptidase [Methyloversatilis sp.]